MNPLVRVLLRLAEKQDDPISYLEDLLTAKFTLVSENGGSLVNASVNGKSYSFSVPAGFDQGAILTAIEQALTSAEQGQFRPMSFAVGRFAR